MAGEGQDALSVAKVSSSLTAKIDFDIIERGTDAQARAEIANALRMLQQTVNNYISRKGA